MSTLYTHPPLVEEQTKILTVDELSLFWNKDRRADRKANLQPKNNVTPLYYDLDKERIKSIIQVEEDIMENYGSYQYNMLTINNRVDWDIDKVNIDRWRDFARILFNNLPFSGFADYLHGCIWTLEKGISSRKWHMHIGFFWREECRYDLLLIFLKAYIEYLYLKSFSKLEIRAHCDFDSIKTERYRKKKEGRLGYLTEPEYNIKEKEEILGIVRKEDYKDRNKILKKILYLCKVEYKKEKKNGEEDNRRRDNCHLYRRHRDNYRDVKKGVKLFGFRKYTRKVEVSRCRDVSRVICHESGPGVSKASMVYYHLSRDYSCVDCSLLDLFIVRSIYGSYDKFANKYGIYKEFRRGNRWDFIRE